ncbi:sugar phosphate isomerase/epimerase [Conexibacter sp. CPCC 206217]|uniref:sugar phosphate isomerase/epimerase family protein n=1 Tax=Conexibacter sp. CPCC 206217 TaxID=3064574 RepID=UPI00271C38C4|nr:sugar phosphate isomerase/epimerase [Conexibacter sp. CPCC 206217]MDO8213163.1 sugar phosphate isomerase/epimerase [Conexibacter sp. CPCC 206217]
MKLGAAGGQRNDARLSYFRAETADDLDRIVEKLDLYGLSAIASPVRTPEMDDDECVEFGEKAASLGLVISEVHFLTNLVAPTPELRTERVELGRSLLRKADLMRARCVLGFAGSAHPSDEIGAQCAYNFTPEFQAELRELVLRVLDGIELKHTKYGLEANNKTFFYSPEGCAELIGSVDHPDFGLHLDMMNMISQATYYRTTEVIDTTFELLGDKIWAAHLKDIRWDRHYQFLRLDEVIVGDGEMDYPTYIRHLAAYDADFPCMCEHLETEDDYVVSFERLHRMAADAGTEWVGRTVPQTA